ncbi:phosphoribosylaminoimidazolesuccinocarboxamide synthase [Enterococcus sp. BWB1-3]|uniref:phosphoribosylaminoimidazolesuccinocarboxamide synthase n=1 Tax=unclassified Enterococcus TaxID=2608891 RepID=UPI0019232FCA|nr:MULTISPECIES: phosphoribosylaminoimidazolesuccinocarboxamide synthase [unclassified Enterococcus]MBL1230355.1 phosphoribosylaminoimidazolesuccinocarboxamide synthase [Enterococcus sp. BWB1-3]MCB5951027.1 phosphoribosylaminoimidazolesuccinocarboxamide synthase [Enterococcus sp. BWT-B8]
MEKTELIYTGKAKKLFTTNQTGQIWIEYLDQATALNGVRKDEILGKAELNNQITSLIFKELAKKDIPSHFIKQLSKTEQLVEAVAIIPLEVVVRNVAAGSFSKKLAIEEGTRLTFPIIEFYYKKDELDDPFINEDHIKYLELATDEELIALKEAALKVNQVLIELFDQINIRLIDFKIEFGRKEDGTILLADEISPDTCRLWDKTTNDHLDKDVYRKELGEIVPVYKEVFSRLKNK